MKVVLLILIIVQGLLTVYYSIKTANGTIGPFEAIVFGINIAGLCVNLSRITFE